MNQPSKIQTVIKNRRSIRKFKPRPIAETTLNRLFDAARFAPSASNRQQYRILVIRDKRLTDQMVTAIENSSTGFVERVRNDLREDAKTYLKHFVCFSHAPVVLAIIYRIEDVLRNGCNTTGSISPSHDNLITIGGVIQNIALAAHEETLGTCCMTGPLIASEELESILDVPNGWSLGALVPVGYPDHSPSAPKRKPIEQLVKYID